MADEYRPMKTVGCTATRRFPFEVRYSDDEHTYWRCYSRHRTLAAAERAYRELRRAMPDNWVQMRNDITGSGILQSHYAPRRPPPPSLGEREG